MASWQETVAVQDFGPAYDRYGSFTTDAVEATPVCLSVVPESGQLADGLGMPAWCQNLTDALLSYSFHLLALQHRAAALGKAARN